MTADPRRAARAPLAMVPIASSSTINSSNKLGFDMIVAPEVIEQRDLVSDNKRRLKYCVVCASNMNRSMQAHKVLAQAKMNVISAGTGSAVRLPGSSINTPNVYDFNTPYDSIYQDLKQKNESLYIQNGILEMLDRNRRIKVSPERYQDSIKTVDIIITCEERCYDLVSQNLLQMESNSNKSVHLINIEIKDNHQSSIAAGKIILRICQELEASEDFEQEIEEILEREGGGYSILHSVLYY